MNKTLATIATVAALTVTGCTAGSSGSRMLPTVDAQPAPTPVPVPAPPSEPTRSTGLTDEALDVCLDVLEAYDAGRVDLSVVPFDDAVDWCDGFFSMGDYMFGLPLAEYNEVCDGFYRSDDMEVWHATHPDDRGAGAIDFLWVDCFAQWGNV